MVRAVVQSKVLQPNPPLRKLQFTGSQHCCWIRHLSTSTQNQEQFLYDGRRVFVSRYSLSLFCILFKNFDRFFCLILTKGILQHQEAILHLATITRSAFRMVSFSSSLFQRVTSAKTSFATCVGQEAVCQICVCVTMRNTVCPQKAAQNTSEVGNLSNRQLQQPIL